VDTQVQSSVISSVVWNETRTGVAWRYLKSMSYCSRKCIAVWHVLTGDCCFYPFSSCPIHAFFEWSK